MPSMESNRCALKKIFFLISLSFIIIFQRTTTILTTSSRKHSRALPILSKQHEACVNCKIGNNCARSDVAFLWTNSSTAYEKVSHGDEYLQSVCIQQTLFYNGVFRNTQNNETLYSKGKKEYEYSLVTNFVPILQSVVF